jgi:hypothetical protein
VLEKFSQQTERNAFKNLVKLIINLLLFEAKTKSKLIFFLLDGSMICISSLSEVVVDVFASDVVDTIVGLKIWPFIVELTAGKIKIFS